MQNVTNPNCQPEFVARRRLSPDYATNLPRTAEVVTGCMLFDAPPGLPVACGERVTQA
jgi:hypothetical protein